MNRLQHNLILGDNTLSQLWILPRIWKTIKLKLFSVEKGEIEETLPLSMSDCLSISLHMYSLIRPSQ